MFFSGKKNPYVGVRKLNRYFIYTDTTNILSENPPVIFCLTLSKPVQYLLNILYNLCFPQIPRDLRYYFGASEMKFL